MHNDYIKYRKARNRLQDIIKRKKRNYVRNKLSENIAKPKELWNETNLGVIAQDVQKVIPEVVTKRSDGYLAIKYEQLIPVLIEGIKEQHTQIKYLQEHAHEPQNYKEKCDEMEKRIIELEKKLEEL